MAEGTESYLLNETLSDVDNKFINLESAYGWYILLEENFRMADQIEIRLPKTQVNEDSAFTATAYFLTRSTKAASTPTTVHYRVDCLTTEKALKDWTSVTPGNSVSIAITAGMNNIQEGVSQKEHKQLIVQINRGLDTQVTQFAIWKVRNLFGT